MIINDIMKNINNFNNTTKITKQNIINFCKSDKDGIVTNTIEYTMLNAWVNGKEKISMPQKPIEAKLDYDKTYKNERDNLNATLFIYRKEDGYTDILIDKDGDGLADARQLNDSYINNPWVQRFDNNLDGKFDEYNKIPNE